MFTSAKYSFLILRLSLAVVFLWFGINRFVHPAYWANIFEMHQISYLFKMISLSGTQLMYLAGIFEVLVGLSLVTGVFIKFFSFLAVIFLLSTIYFISGNNMAISNLGLAGGFGALIFWPEAGRRF